MDGGDGGGDLDVCEALDAVVAAARHAIDGRARLVRSYTPVPRARGNRRDLESVFLGLLLNACRAIEEAGQAGSESGRIIWLRVELEGCDVQVSIADTGAGMAPEHAFGLAASRRIVRQLGGELSAWSVLGSGSTFRVRIPAAPSS